DARLDAEAPAALLPRTGAARDAARTQPPRSDRRAGWLALLAEPAPAALSPHQSLPRATPGQAHSATAGQTAFPHHRRNAALERAAALSGNAQTAGEKALRADQPAGGAGKRQTGQDADRRSRQRARILFQGAEDDAAGGCPKPPRIPLAADQRWGWRIAKPRRPHWASAVQVLKSASDTLGSFLRKATICHSS